MGNITVFSLYIFNNFIYAGASVNSVYRRPLGELVGIVSNKIVSEFSLSQNYPNPFNPVTRIKFQIEKPGFVKFVVFDVLGQKVAELVNKQLQPGTYETEWSATGGGTNYPSGVYFYKLTTPDFTQTKKMVLIK